MMTNTFATVVRACIIVLMYIFPCAAPFFWEAFLPNIHPAFSWVVRVLAVLPICHKLSQITNSFATHPRLSFGRLLLRQKHDKYWSFDSAGLWWMLWRSFFYHAVLCYAAGLCGLWSLCYASSSLPHTLSLGSIAYALTFPFVNSGAPVVWKFGIYVLYLGVYLTVSFLNLLAVPLAHAFVWTVGLWHWDLTYRRFFSLLPWMDERALRIGARPTCLEIVLRPTILYRMKWRGEPLVSDLNVLDRLRWWWWFRGMREEALELEPFLATLSEAGVQVQKIIAVLGLSMSPLDKKVVTQFLILLAALYNSTTMPQAVTSILAFLNGIADPRVHDAVAKYVTDQILHHRGRAVRQEALEWSTVSGGLKIVSDGVKKSSVQRLQRCLHAAVYAGLAARLGFKVSEKDIENAGKMGKFEGTFDLLGFLSETISLIGDAIHTRGWNMSLFSSDMSASELDKLYSDIVAYRELFLLEQLEKVGMTSQEYVLKISDCISKLNNLVETYKATGGHPAERQHLVLKLINVKKIEADVLSRLSTENIRIQPFTYKLSGRTGQAKTVFSHEFMPWLLATNGFASDARYIASLNESDKFDSNLYSYTTGVVADDVPILNDKFAATTPVEMVIRMANNARCEATKAEIEFKGKILLTPKVLGITTNLQEMNFGIYSVCPHACHRRINLHAHVEGHPHWTLPNGMLDIPKIQAHIQAHGKTPDHQLFTVQHWVPEKLLDENAKGGHFETSKFLWPAAYIDKFGYPAEEKLYRLSTVKFYHYAQIVSERWFASQRAMISHTKQNYDPPCVTCAMPLARCTCGLVPEAGEEDVDPFCVTYPGMYPAARPESLEHIQKVRPRTMWTHVSRYVHQEWARARAFCWWSSLFERAWRDVSVCPSHSFPTTWAIRIHAWSSANCGTYVQCVTRLCAQLWVFFDWTLSKSCDWVWSCSWFVPLRPFGHLLVPSVRWVGLLTNCVVALWHGTSLSYMLFWSLFGWYAGIVLSAFGISALKTATSFAIRRFIRRHINRKLALIMVFGAALAAATVGRKMYVKRSSASKKGVDVNGLQEETWIDTTESDRTNIWLHTLRAQQVPHKIATMAPEHAAAKVSSGVCRVTFHFPTGVMRTSQGLCYNTERLLVNWHSMFSKEGGLASHYSVRFGPDGHGGNIRRIPVDQNLTERVWAPSGRETDLVVIHMGRGGSRFDLRPFFSNTAESFQVCPGLEITRLENGETHFEEYPINSAGLPCTRWDGDEDGFFVVEERRGADQPTYVGLCGAPVCRLLAGRPIIVGLHALGDGKRGFATTIVMNWITDAERKMESRVGYLRPAIGRSDQPNTFAGSTESVAPLHPKGIHRHLPEDGVFNVLGGSTVGLSRSKTDYVPLSIKEDVIAECKVEPTHGPPKNLGKPVAFNEQLAPRVDTTEGFPSETLDLAFADLLFTKIAALGDRINKIGPYKLTTVVNGLPGVLGCERMKLNTSLGFPFRRPKSTEMEMTDQFDEFGAQVATISPWMETEFHRLDDIVRRGERLHLGFSANQKDELVTLGKEKVRVFFAINVFLSMLVRKYLLPIWVAELETPCEHETAVGINAHGREWEKLCAYITSKGGVDRVLAGDYKSFDAKTPAPHAFAALRIYEEVAKRSPLYTGADLLAVRVLIEELRYAPVEVLSTLVECSQGNASGHNGTTPINGTTNSLNFRGCWYELLAAHDWPKLRVGVVPSIPDARLREVVSRVGGLFCDFNSIVTYGDDVCGSVSPDAPLFDNMWIAARLCRRGIVYTDEDKKAPTVPYKNISEITFLKRTFRVCEDTGYIFAPLALTSITKALLDGTPPSFEKTGISEQEHCATLIGRGPGQGALMELFLHGEDVYEQFQTGLTRVVEKNKLQSYFEGAKLPTFSEQMLHWEEKYGGLRQEAGDEEIDDLPTLTELYQQMLDGRDEDVVGDLMYDRMVMDRERHPLELVNQRSIERYILMVAPRATPFILDRRDWLRTDFVWLHLIAIRAGQIINTPHGALPDPLFGEGAYVNFSDGSFFDIIVMVNVVVFNCYSPRGQSPALALRRAEDICFGPFVVLSAGRSTLGGRLLTL